MAIESSRRGFLRAAGSGIAVAWSGLNVVGGPDALARESLLEPDTTAAFVYGAYWNRPPGPPNAERRSLIQAMAGEFGFNTLRVWSSWDYNNPSRDHFDFSNLDEILSYCDEFNLKALVTINIENAPYWLEAAHPETRYVDANDHVQRLRGIGHHVTGGYPGLCLDWQPVRDVAAKFIRETARVASSHPCLYAYDCWNEPHAEPYSEVPNGGRYCYCEKTLATFREWLRQRYRTLETLNDTWVRRYPSWETVDPPRAAGTYLDWLDWYRFMVERTTAEMRFRIEHIRAIDPRRVLESHSVSPAAVMPIVNLGINPWRLADVMEVWGLSFYPRWFDLPIYRGVAQLELTRSQAGTKPFWMAELQGGSGLADGDQKQMRPRDIRLWNWLAIATGSKGVIYEKYLAERTGLESGRLALLARDGSSTERSREAAETGRLIGAYRDLIAGYRPKAEVAILFEQDCAALTFAMTGSEEKATEAFSGYYKAMWCCDLWVDFIEPTNITDSSYKVIIVPWHPLLKKETAGRLRDFVEAGGTLILESGFGTYDERTFYNPVSPSCGLSEAFGYREGEPFYLTSHNEDSQRSVTRGAIAPSERIYSEAQLTFSEPIAVTVKARTYLTPIIASTATIIAKYETTPAAAKKKLGKGHAYYIGTSLGASVEAGEVNGVALMKSIVGQVVRPAVGGGKLRPRLIEGNGRALLIVINEDAEDQREAIRVPSHYRYATDIYSDEKQEVQRSTLSLAVPFESVSVLLLE